MSALANLVLDGDGTAFDPTAGNTFVVNATARLICQALQAGNSEPQIVDLLVETYQLPRAEAERDMLDFCGRLRGLGLV